MPSNPFLPPATHPGGTATVISGLTLCSSLLLATPALALPPPEDIPEEILRTEIITEARSPLTGAPLSAAEYADLMERLQDPNRNPQVSAEVAELIGLLQFRRVLKPVLPFIR